MKYIYLDQNKWIELAKGLKKKDSKYLSLYEEIIKNVKSGIWAFPLSLIHITETMKRKNESSRKDILDLMFSIFNGYAICDYMTADNLEFDSWINRKCVDISLLNGKIIRQDWVSLIGLSSENATIISNDSSCLPHELDIIKQMIKNSSCSREVFDLLCNIISCNRTNEDETFYYKCYVDGREDFISWKNKITCLDEYSDKHLYPAYLIKVFFEVYKDKLKTLPSSILKDICTWYENNSTNKTTAIANLEILPGFSVFNRLVFELYNNPSKDVHEHDFNNLAYLRVAIPYCDVVIGENYWCDRVQYYKLDKKYNTIVTTKLLSLTSI